MKKSTELSQIFSFFIFFFNCQNICLNNNRENLSYLLDNKLCKLQAQLQKLPCLKCKSGTAAMTTEEIVGANFCVLQ